MNTQLIENSCSLVHRIRLALMRDIDQLLALEQASFTHDLLSRRAVAWALRAPSQDVLVIETDARGVIGAAFLHYRRGSKRCRLYSIAIRQDQSRHGLGTRLLSACELAARHRGSSEMRLEVGADRRSVARFYERRGYRSGEVKPGFYEDGSDAIVMRKAL
jgi:ribosomal protein S18 acetylase RimI-like enzyme